MAEYLIRYKDMQSQVDELQSISKTLAAFESRLNSIANAMDTRDNNVASLKAQIENTANQISSLTNRVKSGSVVVSSIVNVYVSAEKSSYDVISAVDTANLSIQDGASNRKEVINVDGLIGCTGATVGAGVEIKTSWWDKLKSGAQDVYDVGKKVVQATGEIVSKIKEEVGPGGSLEGAWLATKATTKIVGSTLFIAGSAASIVLGNPAGVLGVIYGVNSFANAATDMWRIDQGEYDKVGSTNYLKTSIEKGSEAIVGSIAYGAGYLAGGKDTAAEWAIAGAEAGETGGTIVYELGDIVSKVLVGQTVICNSNEVYTKIKDVMELDNSSKIYGFIEKVVDWADDPLEKFVEMIVPKSDDTLGEIAEKATGKVVSKLLEVIDVFS